MNITCRTMIGYLQRFDPDENVGVVVADVEKRLHHINKAIFLIDESPAFMISVAGNEPLDEILEEVPDEDRNEGQNGELPRC